MKPPIRILALDAGAGTQDIVLYESDREPENCVKLVLPSQTQVVATRIRRITSRARPLYLAGYLMGGGASSDAIHAHLAAGLPVSAQPDAARTLHNDLDRVQRMGIELTELPPLGAEIVWLGDVDVPALTQALRAFEVELPALWAIAVQDHGYDPSTDAHEHRYRFLAELLEQADDLRSGLPSTPGLPPAHASRSTEGSRLRAHGHRPSRRPRRAVRSSGLARSPFGWRRCRECGEHAHVRRRHTRNAHLWTLRAPYGWGDSAHPRRSRLQATERTTHAPGRRATGWSRSRPDTHLRCGRAVSVRGHHWSQSIARPFTGLVRGSTLRRHDGDRLLRLDRGDAPAARARDGRPATVTAAPRGLGFAHGQSRDESS